MRHRSFMSAVKIFQSILLLSIARVRAKIISLGKRMEGKEDKKARNMLLTYVNSIQYVL